MKSQLLLVAIFILFSYVSAQAPLKFVANVLIQDSFTTGPPLTRVTPDVTTMYYHNTGTGDYERIRYDIPLPGGILSEFYRYEGFQIRWTVCNGACTWQDIYDEHFPTISKMPGVSSTTVGPLTLLDGTIISTVDRYVLDGGQTELYLLPSTNQPVRVVSTDPDPVNRERVIDFVGSFDDSGSFDSDSTFDPPAYFEPQNGNDPLCVDVDPRCYRLDLMVVFDASGSVEDDWGKEVDFGYQLAKNLRVEPGWTRAGYQIFRTKAFSTPPTTDDDAAGCCLSAYPEFQPLTQSAEEIRLQFWDLYDQGDVDMSRPWTNFVWTSIVDGCRRGLNEIATNGRTFSNAALLVITDGNGNRPCSTFNEFNITTMQEGDMGEDWSASVYESFCTNSNDPCNADSPCWSLHNDHIVDLYNFFAGAPWYPPTIYAIGVGDVNPQTLEIIVSSEPGVTDPNGLFFTVASFSALDSILDEILGLFLCELPGRAKCPKDCLPGGFCCAGGCVCAENCALLFGNECQEGVCVVSQVNGTQCQRGAPNDGSCFDGDPCTEDICVDGSGCTNPEIPDNQPCDDGNGCTEGDICVNRVCSGTPIPDEDPDTTDSACTDNNLCTQDHCEGGECISEVIPGLECDDDSDPEDCLIPYCDPSTGSCTFRELEENQICLETDPEDCDVYICVEGDNGEKTCEKRTRNLSKCEDDESVPVGAIVGAVLAFVALAVAICCILLLVIILIVLLVLMAKSGAEAAAIIGGFGANIEAMENPTFIEATTFNENALHS